MVVVRSLSQGDIIKLDLSTVTGHEQDGYRPAIVISKTSYIRLTGLVIVCPITNTTKNFPTHVKIEDQYNMITTGSVLCEHVRALDVYARGFRYIESAPNHLLNDVLHKVRLSIQND